MCEHENFETLAKIVRLTDVDDGPVTGYMLEVTVKCVGCGTPFEFVGLGVGLDYRGARTSFDRVELRAAIVPSKVPS